MLTWNVRAADNTKHLDFPEAKYAATPTLRAPCRLRHTCNLPPILLMTSTIDNDVYLLIGLEIILTLFIKIQVFGARRSC